MDQPIVSEEKMNTAASIAQPLLFSDGKPRLTYGGFVGTANVDPRYAVKVKGKNIYVDYRDFFDIPAASHANTYRNKASRLIRHTRRWSYAHRMAKQANIPMTDVIYIPSNEGEEMVAGTVTDVDQHLIGIDKERELAQFPTLVVKRVKRMCTVRVAYRKVVLGKVLYTSKIIDPVAHCKLHWQNHGGEITAWPIEKNGIEENNIQLEIPSQTVLAFAPDWIRSDLVTAYQNDNASLSIRIPVNASWWSKFKKGFMSVVRKVSSIAEKVVPIAKTVVKIAQMIGEPGDPNARCRLFQLGNLNDLVTYIQSRPGYPDSLRMRVVMNVISPIAQGVITTNPEATGDAVAGNGFSINDIEMTECQNFTDFCRHLGYSSIDAMFEDTAANGRANRVKYIVYGNIALGMKKLWQAYQGMGEVVPLLPTNGEGDLPDEIDYRSPDIVYPVDPADINTASMDITGIGAKELVSNVDTYHNPDAEVQPALSNAVTTLDTDIVDFSADYSIGNSIPRKLIWELSPDFEGTTADVGKYLPYTAFDFDRISLYLEDDYGFRVPCNTGAVSVLNFDTTKIVRGGSYSSTATLKFTGQGGTVITAPFEYTVVNSPIVAMVSDTLVKEVQIGTMFNPRWLINVVSDTPLDSEDPGFKNIGVLTPSGFDIEVEDLEETGELRTPGEHKITITPKGNEDIQSEVTIKVMDFFRVATSSSTDRALTREEVRERYTFTCWVHDDIEPTIEPGRKLSRNDIYMNVINRMTHIPIFSGRATDLCTNQYEHVNVLLNGLDNSTDSLADDPDDSPKSIIEGTNLFVVRTQHLVSGAYDIPFNKTYYYKPSSLKFALKDASRYKLHTAFPDNRIISNDTDDETAYNKSDFSLTLVTAGGTEIEVTDFDIEIGSPVLYRKNLDGSAEPVGTCVIRPCNIAGINPSVYGGARVGVAVPVCNPGYSTYTCSLSITSVLSPMPYPINALDSWVDKSKYRVVLTYKFGDTLDSHQIDVDPDLVKWEEYLSSSTSTPKLTRVGNELFRFGSGEATLKLSVPAHGSSMQEKYVYLPYGTATTAIDEFTARFNGLPDGAVMRVPFGSMITTDMLNVTAACGYDRKNITSPLTIYNYYPLKYGIQKITVRYGVPFTEEDSENDDDHTYSAELTVNVNRPQIIDVKSQFNTSKYMHGQDMSDVDVSITGVTDNNIEYVVPTADVTIPDFDTRGAENQTGMASIQYPAEGTGITGTIAVATSKYDVGEGGGNAVFNLPAFWTRQSHPYCFVGDINPGVGLELAYNITMQGDRSMIDTESVITGYVDTSAAGIVDVTLSVSPSTWRECNKK